MTRLFKASAVALAVALLLNGCGSSGGGSETASIAGQAKKEGTEASTIAPAKVEVADYPTGVSELRDLTKQFKQAVESGNDEEPKRIAAEIAGVWEAVKQEAQSKNAELYPQLEQDLASFLGLFSSEKLDNETAIQQAYQLYQRFRDLSKALEGN
ncbi:hypothetical protein [Paenibacillus sp. MMS18-CY102]|uniref:hypothetical protein n=1 Tax=Paenibacillus sp. MMS18-CY102 TaxID=2682849 RepID=UPI0013653AAB|nr:hypothetical protein [Paenibacillus sp. MMS18-CY102]MWC29961.1 hypothetical protein [Paenibacillus sp. MMS18-CY102]